MPQRTGMTSMDVVPSPSVSERLERFLDEIDTISDPRKLEEPFLTLWLRVHGLDRSAISGPVAKDAGTVQDLIPSSVEIAPSPGLDPATLERTGGIKRIEVLTQNEVGPTFEMKVEKKKLTFKMADNKDVRASNMKREAGNLMVGLQSKLVPLTGLGGEVPQLQDRMRDVAKAYKDGDYERAMDILNGISERMASEEFMKDMLIKVQRRMADYQQLGVDLTKAKEGFRTVAASFKEGRDDFYPSLSVLLKDLEDSVRGLGIEDVAVEVLEPGPEVVSAPPAVGTPKAPSEQPIGTVEQPKEMVKTPEPAQTPAAPVKGTDEPAPKPVVKFVKKKLTLQPEEPIKPPSKAGTPATDGNKEEGREDTVPPSVPPRTSGPQKGEKGPAVDKDAPTERPVKKEDKDLTGPTDDEKEARKKEAGDAFKRIQLVHKAATAMHKKGKDVTQIFDLLRYAEEARKKGDLKAYVGVSKQLESMLLSLQSKT